MAASDLVGSAKFKELVDYVRALPVDFSIHQTPHLAKLITVDRFEFGFFVFNAHINEATGACYYYLLSTFSQLHKFAEMHGFDVTDCEQCAVAVDKTAGSQRVLLWRIPSDVAKCFTFGTTEPVTTLIQYYQAPYSLRPKVNDFVFHVHYPFFLEQDIVSDQKEIVQLLAHKKQEQDHLQISKFDATKVVLATSTVDTFSLEDRHQATLQTLQKAPLDINVTYDYQLTFSGVVGNKQTWLPAQPNALFSFALSFGFPVNGMNPITITAPTKMFTTLTVRGKYNWPRAAPGTNKKNKRAHIEEESE